MKNIFKFAGNINNEEMIGFKVWIFGRKFLIWWDKENDSWEFRIHPRHDALYIGRLTTDWDERFSRR